VQPARRQASVPTSGAEAIRMSCAGCELSNARRTPVTLNFVARPFVLLRDGVANEIQVEGNLHGDVPSPDSACNARPQMIWAHRVRGTSSSNSTYIVIKADAVACSCTALLRAQHQTRRIHAGSVDEIDVVVGKRGAGWWL